MIRRRPLYNGSYSHDVKMTALGAFGVMRLQQRVLCLYIYLLSFLHGAEICFDMLHIRLYMIIPFRSRVAGPDGSCKSSIQTRVKQIDDITSPPRPHIERVVPEYRKDDDEAFPLPSRPQEVMPSTTVFYELPRMRISPECDS
jgi:hypothetical protein